MEQDDAKAVREIAAAIVAYDCLAADKIKEVESELAFLKGYDVSTPTSQHLETARQEINDLKTQLDVNRGKYGITEKEIEVQELLV